VYLVGCPADDVGASSDTGSSASDDALETSAATTEGGTTETTAGGTASATSTSAGTTDVDTTAADDSAGDTAACIAHFFDIGNPTWCHSDAECCPGTKCVPMVGNYDFGTRCRPIARDPAAIGEPCTQQQGVLDGFDDCEAGAVCWQVDSMTSEGTCVALCDGSCRDAALSCHQFGGYTGTFELCIPSCDPLAPDCVEGWACTESSAGYGCFPEGTWP
jgi:hypothetical protein